MRTLRFVLSGPTVLACVVVAALAALPALTGCSRDGGPASPIATSGEPSASLEESTLPVGPGVAATDRSASEPPPGLVIVSLGGESLELWPYTGNGFDGVPADPVNLVFAGEASPLQIRAALLSLDGDRTAFGLPDAPPFNAVWSEAIGDVQTAFAGNEGWTGNYVQLQLGDYEPVRAHLRLFETAASFGDGVWTVGAAHFEIMIPGTADHQVIHWELAEQLVTVDLLRSGLLDPNLPLMPSGPIHPAPAFQEIPAVIYNGLPPELQQLILGPDAPPQVTEPVGIPTDGQATVFQLAAAVAVTSGAWSQAFTKTYAQVIPKPFCNDGEEFVLVTGPVSFEKSAQILPSGRYLCQSRYEGALTVTPWDIINGQPSGPSYPAIVSGTQHGTAFGSQWRTQAKDLRRGEHPGEDELLTVALDIGADGPKRHSVRTRCLDNL